MRYESEPETRMTVQKTRLLTAFALAMLLSVPAAANRFDHSSYDGLLDKAVEGKKVDYKVVGKHMKVLDAYLKRVARFDVNKLNGQPAKLAFYTNAYNALVLKAVVMNRIPKSVMKVKGFFDKTKYKVAGEMLTLNQLEEKKLRSAGDPRVHFVVNCASASCPPLHEAAYTAENWDELLEQKTKEFLERRGEVMIDNNKKTVTVSPLFKWYQGDWENEKGVRDFLAKYLPDQQNQIKDPAYALTYYEYDWSLNGL